MLFRVLVSLVSDEGAPTASPVSWSTFFTGNALFWLVYSVVGAMTRVSSPSAPIADWLQAWVLTTPQWMTGLLFMPLVFMMARWFPLDSTTWKQNIMAHALGGVGLTLSGLAVQQGLYFALHPTYAARVTGWTSYTNVVADMALLCLMLYAGGVGIYHALSFGARLHRTEARRPTLDQQLDTTDTTRASSTEASPDRILVIARNALVPIPVDAIRWIEAADAYVKLHTTDGVHLHRARLKNIAVQLAPKGFIRIHRSTVIRLDALDRVETASGGAYVAVLDDGTRRRVSQSYRADLLDALGATEDAL